jgi:hypothetical protein
MHQRQEDDKMELMKKKSMTITLETYEIREKIKKSEKFTDEELEQYFILAVLYAHKNKAIFVNNTKEEKNELYKELYNYYRISGNGFSNGHSKSDRTI